MSKVLCLCQKNRFQEGLRPLNLDLRPVSTVKVIKIYAEIITIN